MSLSQPQQALAGGGDGGGHGEALEAVRRPALAPVSSRKKPHANRSSIYLQEVWSFVEGMQVL